MAGPPCNRVHSSVVQAKISVEDTTTRIRAAFLRDPSEQLPFPDLTLPANDDPINAGRLCCVRSTAHNPE